MINSTKRLNEIIRNLSIENANSSIGQVAAIINLCSKAGIRFSYDVNYEEALASFTVNKFPEWNMEGTESEIESPVNFGKNEATTESQDKTLLKKEIHRRFRIEKYRTEDWFTKKSESEIFYLPTEIAGIDNLIFEKIYEK